MLVIKQLIHFTYRTFPHIGLYRVLNTSHLNDFKTHTKCASERTKNVRIKSGYRIDNQVIKKGNVRKCAGQNRAKNKDWSKWSGISGSFGERQNAH